MVLAPCGWRDSYRQESTRRPGTADTYVCMPCLSPQEDGSTLDLALPVTITSPREGGDELPIAAAGALEQSGRSVGGGGQLHSCRLVGRCSDGDGVCRAVGAGGRGDRVQQLAANRSPPSQGLFRRILRCRVPVIRTAVRSAGCVLHSSGARLHSGPVPATPLCMQRLRHHLLTQRHDT